MSTAKTRIRIDVAAAEVMRERGHRFIWYGDPDMIGEVSERAGAKQGHPLNRSASVMNAVARSKLFKHAGAIVHLGRRYNLYERTSKEESKANA